VIEVRTEPRAGRYGRFGGRYVPEVLVGALVELEDEMVRLLSSTAFRAELERERASWCGRPTPLTRAARLGERYGCELFLKREDLAHTGAHKINNALGQALLARHLGKRRVIAETGAGQHGVAAAAACARLGLSCRVYMGAVDVARQALNVQRMRLLGAEVVPVDALDGTLRAAIDEALRAWSDDPRGTYYLLGSAVGPHPYPALVRELQSVIGHEARAQVLAACGALPDAALACVGGGSNAIGLFPASWTTRRSSSSGWRRAVAGRNPARTAPRSRAADPACCTARTRISCRTSTARCWRRTRSPPGSTIPASDRSTPG
jgi:tryptophan synthase beta chain